MSSQAVLVKIATETSWRRHWCFISWLKIDTNHWSSRNRHGPLLIHACRSLTRVSCTIVQGLPVHCTPPATKCVHSIDVFLNSSWSRALYSEKLCCGVFIYKYIKIGDALSPHACSSFERARAHARSLCVLVAVCISVAYQLFGIHESMHAFQHHCRLSSSMHTLEIDWIHNLLLHRWIFNWSTCVVWSIIHVNISRARCSPLALSL